MEFDKSELIGNSQYLYKGEGFSHKLPTGIPSFDIALGGGIPLDGSIIEIWGEEGAGKTTLSYRICKRATDHGGYITWFDSEASYDDSWATIQGLDVRRVIPYRPPYMEAVNQTILEDIKKYKEVYLPWLVNEKWKPSAKDCQNAGTNTIEKVKEYMKEVAPEHMIVWDSLAASPVKSQVEGDDFAQGMAYRARLIKSFLSRYQVTVEGCEKIGLILINQVIDNIGDMYGPGITTPGGRGLRHGKHLSIYVKKNTGERDSDNFQATNYTMLSITKNKVTPVIASFPVIFSKSKGFIGATSILEYLMNIRWFRDSGSWKKFDYEYVDKDTGEIKTEEISIQRGSFYKLLEQRPELLKYLCNKIKDMFLEKFPLNKTLQNTDVDAIIRACLEEESSMPEEGEESVQTNPENLDINQG